MKYVILALAVTIWCSSICTAENPRTGDKFRIGVIMPFTGTSATMGRYAKNGVELALRDMAPEVRNKIEVIYEDDGWQVPRSISAFQKLLALNKINAAIVCASPPGIAVGAIAEKAKVLVVAVGASSLDVVKGRRYSFTHWVTPESEGREATEEVFKRGYKRIAVINAEQEGMVLISNAFRKEMAAKGLADKIVLDEKYLPDVTDYRTFITKAKKLEVQAVFMGMLLGPVAAFAKQNRDLGLNADLAGAETFQDDQEVKASEGALLGHWFVSDDENTSAFVRSYIDTYHENPGFTSGNAYDTMMIMAAGVNNYGDDVEEIVDYMHNLKDFEGACGRYSATGDNRFDLPAAVRVVKENGYPKLHK